MATKKNNPLTVETLKHDGATRKNIPTAEYQSVMAKDEQKPVRVEYERRNRDLDPQLVWRGKDEQDWSDLVVHAPPLYIQEKVHPKVLVDDLKRESERQRQATEPRAEQVDLFADFNGLPNDGAKTEFYQHDAHWANRMILGDSLQVMASLAEREGLRGKVQCIYFDPPYGIKFNSNFQWSTDAKTVVDGKADHITREPEQVKAFRDTWRDGVHSYLTYIRDRLTVCRDLLHTTGSLFVQIGDENMHRVRSVLDEVFGANNFVSVIAYSKTTGAGSGAGGTNVLASVTDFILWYAKDLPQVKYRQLFREKVLGEEGATKYDQVQHADGTRRTLTSEERSGSDEIAGRVFTLGDLTSQTGVDKTRFDLSVEGRVFRPHPSVWKTGEKGMSRLLSANRVVPIKTSVRYQRFLADFAAFPMTNVWLDIGGVQSRSDPKVYVVQTSTSAIERCLLMATDPGDLVLDPTCGSGTTAYVAERWGRR